MERVRLGIVGAGNIVGTRHLPALNRARSRFDIVGIVDPVGKKSQALALKYDIPNAEAYEKYGSLADMGWFRDVDAVLVATPPMDHYRMCKMALQAGKHVLVEKPFVVDLDQGRELIELASRNNLRFAVNHNFQFSNAFSKARGLIENGKLGEISGFSSVQISNGERRLPAWSESLPAGLFYDESPHVLYLFRSFVGALPTVSWAHSVRGEKPQTPRTLTFELAEGALTCQVYINFNSPLCEWTFSIYGSRAMAVIDLFRDILIVLPNDGQHLMKEVLRTSASATIQHWLGFTGNGAKYVRNRLDYGFVTVHKKFFEAINSSSQDMAEIDAREGLHVNELQHGIIDLCASAAPVSA